MWGGGFINFRQVGRSASRSAVFSELHPVNRVPWQWHPFVTCTCMDAEHAQPISVRTFEPISRVWHLRMRETNWVLTKGSWCLIEKRWRKSKNEIFLWGRDWKRMDQVCIIEGLQRRHPNMRTWRQLGQQYVHGHNLSLWSNRAASLNVFTSLDRQTSRQLVNNITSDKSN